jgi:hypothetical protein
LWVAGLERCINDSDPALAIASVEALGSIGSWGAFYINEWHGDVHSYGKGSAHKRDVQPALERALQHRDPSVRAAVTNALLKVAPEVLLSEWELREKEAREENRNSQLQSPGQIRILNWSGGTR